jgi:hypothetical protein
MKRLFFTVCLLSGVISFSACGGGDEDDKENEKETEADKVKPVITIPTNADGSLYKFDLGDEDAAKEGVTAKDDVDGDITSSITVIGNFEKVGKTQLKYKVSDKAGNVAEVTRDVIITADKLAGGYSAIAKLQPDTITEFRYTMIVEVEQDTVLKITQLQNLPDIIRTKFGGDYSFEINEKEVTHSEGGLPTISGTLSYGTQTDKYKIASLYYTFTWRRIQKDEEVWRATCTPNN